MNFFAIGSEAKKSTLASFWQGAFIVIVHQPISK